MNEDNLEQDIKEERKKSNQELLMEEEEKERLEKEAVSAIFENNEGLGNDETSMYVELETKEAADDQNTGKKQRKSGFMQGLVLGFCSCIVLLVAAGAIFVNVIRMQSNHVSSLSAESVSTQGTEKAQEPVLSTASEKKINDLVKAIDTYYYKDVDNSDLTTGLYKGLLSGLNDPYSAYYTPKEYKKLLSQVNGNFYGIGALLQQDPTSMQVTITKVYDDSPAQKAGLKAGDIIDKVGDTEATSMELSQLVEKIRGQEGTTIHLKIYRQGEDGYLEFDIKRGKVNEQSVSGKMLEDGVGYIQISEFASDTSNQFESTVKDLQSQGMTKMIVDLRDNGGGLVTAVTKILDDILPKGVVVYTKDKYGNRQDFTSSGDTVMNYPMVVLVNGYSASASEIFAGAIRDYKYGTLIGTKTFGKGIVQNTYPLKDGGAIKLTVAKYYTPNGDNIQGTGITPDIILKYEYTGDSSQPFDYTKDNQIEKAISVLKDQAK